ncbi:TPA: hypothetical protein ACGSTK_003910 [Vibrio parahaemolyticus]|nr:hypothetical protein [Vibrio parahaemolyticus]MDF5067805.1 hypothetical protein [Vibrio parahaemolyticus]HBC3440598.1 hypothetical protein [Vibrio parahaemolyticus]HBC3455109.1 hypothetical protein [Vibrio parahaemolyticus]HBH7885526.1 hypothetical protein [Vibrio parahaemolyticus]
MIISKQGKLGLSSTLTQEVINSASFPDGMKQVIYSECSCDDSKSLYRFSDSHEAIYCDWCSEDYEAQHDCSIVQVDSLP